MSDKIEFIGFALKLLLIGLAIVLFLYGFKLGFDWLLDFPIRD